MSNRLIQRCGEALFGSRWQTDMAGEIDVSDRTVRRWASGEVEPRPGVYADLLHLVRQRRIDLDALETLLERTVA